jgi:hypothetical protein
MKHRLQILKALILVPLKLDIAISAMKVGHFWMDFSLVVPEASRISNVVISCLTFEHLFEHQTDRSFSGSAGAVSVLMSLNSSLQMAGTFSRRVRCLSHTSSHFESFMQTPRKS